MASAGGEGRRREGGAPLCDSELRHFSMTLEENFTESSANDLRNARATPTVSSWLLRSRRYCTT